MGQIYQDRIIDIDLIFKMDCIHWSNKSIHYKAHLHQQIKVKKIFLDNS